jgi:hypothetical protein
MTNSVFDASNPLPPETANARLELADAGSALIDLDVSSDTLRAIQANFTQHLLIAAASHVNGGLDAVELIGSGSSLYNEGVIGSATGAGVLLSGGGTTTVTNIASSPGAGAISGIQGIAVASSTSLSDRLDLFNSGTIIAETIAIRGGYGNDHIVIPARSRRMRLQARSTSSTSATATISTTAGLEAPSAARSGSVAATTPPSAAPVRTLLRWARATIS